MGKNVNFVELRRGLGLVRGLGDEFRLACERVNPPVEALHRLVTPQGHGTMDEMVRLAVAAWRAEQPQPSDAGHPVGDHLYRSTPMNRVELPADHYRMHLTCAPMPSLASLKAEFGEDRVSIIFDGRAWELHKSCEGMDRTPGERTFCLHDAGRDWEREERIEWGLAQRTATAPNGYRPATHDEEIEFSRAHPELMDYVALGSSPLHGGHRGVAYVWSGGGQRVLGINWLGHRFGARIRGLFVSK